MKKLNVFKTLSIITLLALCAGKSYADGSEITQLLKASVPPTVSINKSTASVEGGTIDPSTGVNSGIKSVFTVETNGGDSDYDFYITSTFPINGTARSAYDGNGNIMFGNLNVLPTESAVDDAIAGGTHNANVISYPVIITTSGEMTVSPTVHAPYGNCYKMLLNGEQEGTLTHTIGTTPATNTYILSQDAAGSYQATIILTAVAK
ncbi:MAG: hypothetical protein MJ230_02765 [bacterium]|nr:hypothetical protein [bacterium]